MTDFAHLHIHSNYSLLKGTVTIKELVSRAVSCGMKYLGLTDLGNMFGVPDFIKACREAAVNPIIGSEFYCTPCSRFDKTESKYHHLVLLASNNEGYKNLLKLSSYSYTEGFYKLPRIDDELLEKHHQGLIGLSGSIDETRALWYQRIFGKDNFFLELQNQINPSLVKISESTGIPLAATDDITFKNSDEMAAIFKDYPGAIANTVRIAERCKVDIPLVATRNLPRYLPEFEIPAAYPSSKAYLHDITMKGLEKRYPGNDSVKKRAEYELGIIDEKGFTAYFLIAADYTNWARERDIPVGPGRGAAPSSLVAFAIGITGIDPIRYNLPFERFINPERDAPPDFDIDFSAENRDRVVDYVTKKYGQNRVGHIVAFAKPGTAKEGKQYYTAIHAAGLVIGKTSLEDYVPLYRDPKTGLIASQYTFYNLEDFGLNKFDFLGLETLDILKRVERLIRKRGNAYSDFSPANIPLDDIRTFDLFQKGDTQGIFQFESEGIQTILRQFKPDCFLDIVLLNACYRPGLMEYLPQLIDRKQGIQPVEYPHPSLEDILKETYGIIVFQEQVMEIIHCIAGYDMGKSDSFRRTSMKRNDDQKMAEKDQFIRDATKQGFSERLSGDLFSTLSSASRYTFNKSHAIACSLIAYQTAYLKANFFEEFSAAQVSL
jgi:DNA polymerase-3 subunit alpha